MIGPRKKIEMCMAPAAMFREDGALFGVIGTPDRSAFSNNAANDLEPDRSWVQHSSSHRGAAISDV